MATCHVLAFEGGDCGGKSTGLKRIKKDLKARGYLVLVAAEVATELMRRGIHYDQIGVPAFQRLVLRQMLAVEDVLREAGRRLAEMAQQDVVILCDRGAMGAAGFTTADDFRLILSEFNQTVVRLRDARYDAVIFMRSVAVDAPHLYTCATNSKRNPDVARAAVLDERLLAAWVGHPHLRVIDNSTGFDEKCERALAVVHNVLGIGGSQEIEDRFLVTDFDLAQFPSHTQAIDIVQRYLVPSIPGDVERIRARGQWGDYLHYHTLKRDFSHGACTEHEKGISREDFKNLGSRIDPSLAEVVKKRLCFVSGGQYLEFDLFRDIEGGGILECEKSHVGVVTRLPDFLAGKARNITGDKAYSNYEIARRLAQIGSHSF